MCFCRVRHLVNRYVVFLESRVFSSLAKLLQYHIMSYVCININYLYSRGKTSRQPLFVQTATFNVTWYNKMFVYI